MKLADDAGDTLLNFIIIKQYNKKSSQALARKDIQSCKDSQFFTG
jgi:hypothetical protein